ncbi:type III secretion protein V [Epibacterium ulvae]|uniref:Type III secretion protein V n=2 Tax=Alphaproteobacteria TaxID=28211 RepID=A0A1G5QKU4_9RHOB|nr:flagellar biosynthesis protein FlhA [Epibacterium ulvae]AGI04144.1 flagellar biosynthesis protein FlhA [alpha proteobacterium U95]SCZ61779.1 type III secretion protein V [Epibacterium ulvae]
MSAIVGFLNRLATQRDLLLIIVFATILIMIILPLPPILMDVMITLNVSMSIMIMLMSLQLHNPVQFSTFPSLLLVTTLFRLAISISTTRLILIEGDAGQVVETFGNVVVGGNLVVGLVIFMIITVVQFMVITKGADRVAEVGARFTLDGMPGKQMSVDADVRAGNLDQVDAKVARELVEREAKLFGAMDGAMKFVKGDAMASLIITAINLIGGVSIGMFQLGYSFSEALGLYSILTIGDGLVAQIPALLISVSAGTLVTRVTNPKGVDLGTEIAEQVTENSRTVIIAGFVIAAFGLIPGFPTFIFMAVGIGMAGGVYWNQRKKQREFDLNAHSWSSALTQNKQLCDDIKSRSGTNPTLRIRLPVCVFEDEATRFTEMLYNVRDSLERDFGIPMGVWAFEVDNFSETAAKIIINNDEVSTIELDTSVVFVRANVSYIDALGIPYKKHFGFEEGVLISAEEAGRIREERIKHWDYLEIFFMEVKRSVSVNLDMLVGFEATTKILNDFSKANPALVADLKDNLSVNQISAVIKIFVQERIPITSQDRIFEAILQWGPKKPDPQQVLQHVRVSIGDFITNRFAPNGFLPAVVIAPTLESFIREGFRNSGDETYLIVDSEISKSISKQVKSLYGDSFKRGTDPVILTQQDIRRPLRNVLHEHGHYVPVLAYQEVSPQTVVYPTAFIMPESHQD